jgi:hypothetical protein
VSAGSRTFPLKDRNSPATELLQTPAHRTAVFVAPSDRPTRPVRRASASLQLHSVALPKKERASAVEESGIYTSVAGNPLTYTKRPHVGSWPIKGDEHEADSPSESERSHDCETCESS